MNSTCKGQVQERQCHCGYGPKRKPKGGYNGLGEVRRLDQEGP